MTEASPLMPAYRIIPRRPWIGISGELHSYAQADAGLSNRAVHQACGGAAKSDDAITETAAYLQRYLKNRST
jgi:hypothetical protein